ncbi:MAG: peptidylprolyl isomerase [Fimbriimonadaceae bacterium]|nr:peptidylprolyl isomerase [Fimbriimonadaceae bacterium]
MRGLSFRVMLLLSASLVLVACTPRSKVATNASGEQKLADVPTDRGGYAGDLADPPAERAVVDVETNIQAGDLTNSQDPVRVDEDEQHKNEEQAKKAAEETAKMASLSQAKDTSGDAKWTSVGNPVVCFQTSRGIIYLELYPDVAPKHTKNMLKLCSTKFYDGIFIHRVEPGFVVQLGDPLTRNKGPQVPNVGSGGPGWKVPAEFNKKQHLRGSLSMARSDDPNSGGSQFFICLDRQERLDGQYTVFGKILGDGMDIVDQMQIGDKVFYAWVVKE